MSFGEILKRSREDAGLTRRELAQKSGVCPSILGQYERGINDPGLFNLICLADALNMSIDDLVGHEPKNRRKVWHK